MPIELQGLPPIVFGCGASATLGAAVARLGQTVALVRGRGPQRSEAVRASLQAAGLRIVEIEIAREPRVDDVRAALGTIAAEQVQVIVACGGGSVIDAGKALAGLATNPGDPLDYLEVVGKGQALTIAPLPWFAVPTTAGTGAEVTRNAVLGVPNRRVKVSLRSPALLARSVWLDPDLLLGLPAPVRAASGMDALTQLLEAYVCSRSSLGSDVWCEAGLPRVARVLPRWVAGDESPEVRETMAWAALWSGAALAQAGLGAVHGLAGPLGGHLEAPHGAVCAALLAPVMAANLSAPDLPSSTRLRYEHVARWLTGRPDAVAADGLAWVRERVREFAIPSLRTWGLHADDFPLLAEQAGRASSMKANPVVLSTAQLVEVLSAAW